MDENLIRPVASFPDLSLAHLSVTHGESLPRWEANGAVYDISLHLADSVPTAQLVAWREKREQIREARTARDVSEYARAALIDELKDVYDERIEKYLTAGHGECLLRQPVVGEAVAEVLKHDNGVRYALHMYTIMPNHAHVIVSGFKGPGEMKSVVDQWKRIAAHAVNRLCGRTGDVWQRDAYTRIIRSREEYAAKLKYVWGNPEAAGLAKGYLRERFV